MNRGSKASADVDLQRMLDTATAFFLAGERCAPVLRFGPYGEHSVEAPRVVSYAFAVEIALKLLACLSDVVIVREHNLKKLFEALPQDARVHLAMLDDCLDSVAGLFEEWRYPYEATFLVGETDGPRRAFIACYQEIRRQRPDLISIYEQNWGNFEPDWQWSWPEKEVAAFEANPA